MAQSENRKTLFLVYPCYLCKDDDGPTFPKAARLILHIRDAHGYLLPSRRAGIRRPANKDYMYQPNFRMKWDAQQYACPSCWYHTESMDELEHHVNETHDPPPCERPLPQSSVYTRRGLTRKKSTSMAKYFVYDGSNYEKKTVNSIFKQIQDITARFKEVLKMD